MQGAVPIVLSVAFIVTILGLAARWLRVTEGAACAIAAVLVLLYLAWLVAESRVAVGEVAKHTTSRDRGTCELYASGRAVTVILGLALSGSPAHGALQAAVGLAVFILGVAFRLVAIRELGRFYSHRVRLAEGHRIVATGPYRWLRHPAYFGMLVAHAGFVACFFHPFALAALVLLLLPAVVLRVRVEEATLFELEGYAEYARGRRRLVPLLW